jgi:ubiquinone biosynthesis protein UbiJ
MTAKLIRKNEQVDGGVSKLDQLVELLSRARGTTIEEMIKITGWQAHSVRGAMAGSIKKRGHVISSKKEDGVRRYRIG